MTTIVRRYAYRGRHKTGRRHKNPVVPFIQHATAVGVCMAMMTVFLTTGTTPNTDADSAAPITPVERATVHPLSDDQPPPSTPALDPIPVVTPPPPPPFVYVSSPRWTPTPTRTPTPTPDPTTDTGSETTPASTQTDELVSPVQDTPTGKSEPSETPTDPSTDTPVTDEGTEPTSPPTAEVHTPDPSPTE